VGKDTVPAPQRRPLPHSAFRQKLTREIALFVGLLFVGFVLMPVAIYIVGQHVFGAYGGQGYDDFFGTLSAKIRAGETVAWFFVLAPYLLWQSLRLTAFGWRVAGKSGSKSGRPSNTGGM